MRQRHVTICYSSQLQPPLHLQHCCQSTFEFCVIKSTSDIVLLQIGRVLISDDKSAFWHCVHRMSNTNVARIRLFGTSDALGGFPSHHLKHDESPYWWGKTYHGHHSMLRSVNEIVCCCFLLLTLEVSNQFLQIFRMWFLERFYHGNISLWMCDGLPSVVFLVVSFPTNFVKSSPYFLTFPSPTWVWKSSPISTIFFGINSIDPSVWFENVFHTGSKYDLTVLISSLPFPWAKVLFVVALLWSTANFSGVVSDATDVEQFFLSRAVSTSGTVRRFCTVLVPSPCLGQGDIKFLFCKVLGPVNRRENWKLGRDVVKTLIISDRHFFHGLIIKSFDNQTVSLPWLSRISDTSENKSVRLDSDNQINISRLISCLGWLKVFVSTTSGSDR